MINMLKHIIAAAALLAGLATSTLAADKTAGPSSRISVAALATPDDCLKSAFDLAQQAEARKLSSAEAEQIEDMLSKLEDHCDARRFPEAEAMAGQIAAMIDEKPAGEPTARE